MGDLREDLQNAANPTGGDALTMGELEGLTFQIIDFTTGESKSAFKGRDTYTWHLAELIVEGDEGAFECQAFLSGARVGRQLDWLKENDRLPIRVRIIRRGDLNGNPWELEPVDEEPIDEPKPKAKVEPKPKGKVETQTPSTEDQQAFLDLTNDLRKKWGADWVKDVVTNTTKATAPRFLTYRADDADPTILHAKLNFSQISAGVLSILMLELKKADKAADEGSSPALPDEVSFD